MIRTNESASDAHHDVLGLATEYEGLVKDLAEAAIEVDPNNDKGMILMAGVLIGFAARAQRLREALEKLREHARDKAADFEKKLAGNK